MSASVDMDWPWDELLETLMYWLFGWSWDVELPEDQ
jgi:hypothetical protein